MKENTDGQDKVRKIHRVRKVKKMRFVLMGFTCISTVFEIASQGRKQRAIEYKESQKN